MATDLSLEGEIVQSKINIFLEKNSKSIIIGILAIGVIALAIAFFNESARQVQIAAQENLTQSIKAEDSAGAIQAWIDDNAAQYPNAAFGAYLKLAELQWDTNPTVSIQSLVDLLPNYSGEQADIIAASLSSKLIELGSEDQLEQAQQILESNQNSSYLSAYLQTILGDIYWKQEQKDKALKLWAQITEQFQTIDPDTGVATPDPFSLAAQNRIDWADFQSPNIIEAPTAPLEAAAPVETTDVAPAS